MNRWIWCAAAVAALCVLPRPVFAGELSVAVVNMNEVFSEYYRVAETEKEFASFQEETVAGLEEDREALAAMEERLQTQQLVLSEAEKEKLQAEIQDKQREMTRRWQQVRENLQQKNRDLVEARVGEIQDVIEKMGQEKGFALVINREAVLYAPEGSDITRLIIEELNRPVLDRE